VVRGTATFTASYLEVSRTLVLFVNFRCMHGCRCGFSIDNLAGDVKSRGLLMQDLLTIMRVEEEAGTRGFNPDCKLRQ